MKHLIVIIALTSALSAQTVAGGKSVWGGKAVLGAAAASGGGPITCVQGGPGCTHTTALTKDCGGGNTGCGLAYGSNVTNGNCLHFIAAVGASASNTTPANISIQDATNGAGKDSGNNSWTCGTQVNTTPNSGSYTSVGVLACAAPVTQSTGADTVTIKLSYATDTAFTIFETHGLADCAIDTSASAQVTTGGTSITSGAYSTALANEFAIANVGDDEACLSGQTAGSGFTLVTPPSCTSIGYGSEYQIYSSTQSGVTASISYSSVGSSALEFGVWVFK